jgi:hypothetical protein
MTTYDERNQGRDFDIVGQKLSVPFVVTGAFNEYTAYAVALAASDVFRQGLYRQNITASHQGNGCWHGTISYGPYQTATGSYPRFDAKKVARPLSGASKGWLEP